MKLKIPRYALYKWFRDINNSDFYLWLCTQFACHEKVIFVFFFSLSTAMCKQCSQGWIMKCTDTDLLNRIKQKWKWIRTAMSSFVITNQQICSCNRLFCSEKSYTVWAPIKTNSTRLYNGFWSRHIKLSLISKSLDGCFGRTAECRHASSM